MMGGRARVSVSRGQWCPEKCVTKKASSNWPVDPSSRFHRSCHVGRRFKGRLRHCKTGVTVRGTKTVSSSVRTWMTWLADRRTESWAGGLLCKCLDLQQYLGRSSDLMIERWRQCICGVLRVAETAIIFPLTSQFIASMLLRRKLLNTRQCLWLAIPISALPVNIWILSIFVQGRNIDRIS